MADYTQAATGAITFTGTGDRQIAIIWFLTIITSIITRVKLYASVDEELHAFEGSPKHELGLEP